MASRSAAERSGRWAENAAAWYLRLCGYHIVARRFLTPAGEIDIVARRGRITAFVEVKLRSTLNDAAEAVTVRQQRRLADAAALWLARNRTAGAVRFDAILVAPWRLPRHIADAFRPDR